MPAKKKLSPDQASQVVAMFETGTWSYGPLGRAFGVSRSTVTRIVQEGSRLSLEEIRDITRKNQYKEGPLSPVWKEGAKHQRRKLYRRMTADGRQLTEHRLVAEQLLGRRLASKEDVHHINGVEDDNSPENLIVMFDVLHGALHAFVRLRTGVRSYLRALQDAPVRAQEAHREFCEMYGLRPLSRLSDQDAEGSS